MERAVALLFASLSPIDIKLVFAVIIPEAVISPFTSRLLVIIFPLALILPDAVILPSELNELFAKPNTALVEL